MQSLNADYVELSFVPVFVVVDSVEGVPASGRGTCRRCLRRWVALELYDCRLMSSSVSMNDEALCCLTEDTHW